MEKLGDKSFALVVKIIGEHELICVKWKNMKEASLVAILEQLKFNLLYKNFQKQTEIQKK